MLEPNSFYMYRGQLVKFVRTLEYDRQMLFIDSLNNRIEVHASQFNRHFIPTHMRFER